MINFDRSLNEPEDVEASTPTLKNPNFAGVSLARNTGLKPIEPRAKSKWEGEACVTDVLCPKLLPETQQTQVSVDFTLHCIVPRGDEIQANKGEILAAPVVFVKMYLEDVSKTPVEEEEEDREDGDDVGEEEKKKTQMPEKQYFYAGPVQLDLRMGTQPQHICRVVPNVGPRFRVGYDLLPLPGLVTLHMTVSVTRLQGEALSKDSLDLCYLYGILGPCNDKDVRTCVWASKFVSCERLNVKGVVVFSRTPTKAVVQVKLGDQDRVYACPVGCLFDVEGVVFDIKDPVHVYNAQKEDDLVVLLFGPRA